MVEFNRERLHIVATCIADTAPESSRDDIYAAAYANLAIQMIEYSPDIQPQHLSDYAERCENAARKER